MLGIKIRREIGEIMMYHWYLGEIFFFPLLLTFQLHATLPTPAPLHWVLSETIFQGWRIQSTGGICFLICRDLSSGILFCGNKIRNNLRIGLYYGKVPLL